MSGFSSTWVGLLSNRVGLLSNGVGLFSAERVPKNTPTPLFEQPLKFIAHGHISENPLSKIAWPHSKVGPPYLKVGPPKYSKIHICNVITATKQYSKNCNLYKYGRSMLASLPCYLLPNCARSCDSSSFIYVTS